MTSLKQVERMERQIDLEKCFRLQRKLAAINVFDKRFTDLYNLMYWGPLVKTAVDIVRHRKGARTAGVDGKNKYNTDHEELAREIIHEVRTDTLRPMALRKQEVPKPNGKVRVLSIPTYKDRCVLTMFKLVLEPIYEPHFDPSSYGFRPNMSTHDAVAEIRRYLGPSCRYAWIMETDIKACFDTIHKGKLMEIMEERIADGRLLQLLRRYLHAGMAMEGFPDDDDPGKKEETGCPQGSPLSPLLCNIYLDKLDKEVNQSLHRLTKELEQGKNLDPKPASVRRRRAYQGEKLREQRMGPFHLIRYADDVVIVSPASKQNVLAYWEYLKAFTRKRLKLEFAEEKTRIVHASEGFTFLGFFIKRAYEPNRKRYIVRVTVDPKRKERHRSRLRELMEGKHDREVGNVITAMNQRIRGWRNYFQHSVTDCRALRYIDLLAFWLLIKWLMKKFKAPISKIFKVFYKRATTRNWRRPLTIVSGRNYLERAVTAMKKHQFDYTRKPCHPWVGKTNGSDMAKACFPNRPRAPDWDGSSGYGENYAKMMRKALERDQYRCNKCGATQNLHVHHINKRNSFENPKVKPANALENLVVLCRSCHKYANRLNAIDCLNWLLSD